MRKISRQGIIRSRLWLVVVIVSFLYTLFLLSPIIFTLFTTPPGHINMLVGHYFEDYYEYLSFIKQGQDGSILMHNLFTNKDNLPFINIWWPYSLVGFLDYLLPIDIPTTFLYWLSSFIFTFLYLILAFKVLCLFLGNLSGRVRLASFLLFLVAGSFYKIVKWDIVPFDFWYSYSSPFSRFNIGTPHHQVTHLIFLLFLFFVMQRERQKANFSTIVGFVFFSLMLLFLSPAQLALFWSAYLTSKIVFLAYQKFIQKVQLPFEQISSFLLPTFASVVVLFPIVYYLKNYLSLSPTLTSVREWDIANLYYPPISLFILTSGPILILAAGGVKNYLAKISFSRLLLLFLVLLSFLFTLFPIPSKETNILTGLGFHNLRFQSPNVYLVLTIMSVGLLNSIFRNSKRSLVAILILLLYFIPPMVWNIKRNATSFSQLAYLHFMPQQLYQGIKKLETANRESVVLTSPQSLLGLVVPGVSGRRVFFGRSIFTPDIARRQEEVNRFYSLKMGMPEAKNFLQREKIGLILLSRLDPKESLVVAHYPFLTVWYENEEVTILQPRN